VYDISLKSMNYKVN